MDSFNAYNNILFNVYLKWNVDLKGTLSKLDLSSTSFKDDLKKIFFDYFTEHLPKPYDQSDLIGKLCDYEVNFIDYICKENMDENTLDLPLSIPIFLYEKQWLKAALNNEAAKGFIGLDDWQTLNLLLEDTQALYSHDNFMIFHEEKWPKMSYEDIEKIHLFNEAIENSQYIHYFRYNTLKKTIPHSIEYSKRNNVYRLSALTNETQSGEYRPIKINFKDILPANQRIEKINDEIKKMFLTHSEEKVVSQPIIIKISKEKHEVIEKFLSTFSYYDKFTTENEEFLIYHLYFYLFDRGEILRDLLSFGKDIEVKFPEEYYHDKVSQKKFDDISIRINRAKSLKAQYEK